MSNVAALFCLLVSVAACTTGAPPQVAGPQDASTSPLDAQEPHDTAADTSPAVHSGVPAHDTRADSAPADAFTDVSPPVDSATPDVPTQPDAPDAPDAPTDADTEVPPVNTLCTANGALPAWVEAGPTGLDFVVHGDVVTLAVSVLRPGVLRLRTVTADAPSPHSSYAIVGAPQQDTEIAFGTTEGGFRVCTSELTVDIAEGTCAVRAVDGDGAALLEDPAAGAWFEGPEAGARGVRRLTPVDEHFYGLGEKTGPLDRRGRTFVMWNTDAYDAALGGYPPDTDPLYQSIPFFIGLRGATAYGVLTDCSRRLEIDLAASDPSVWSIRTTDGGPGDIDQYLIVGPSFADVLSRYTWLTGRMPLPPRWTLGYHQSRWGYYPDSRVLEVAETLRANGLPADGMWLDIQAMDGFRSFTFDPVGFPDPAGLVSALKELGLHTTVIVDPGIKVDPGYDIYTEGLAQGLFLASADGTPYEGEVWPGKAVFPDFTSAKTRAFWAALAPRLTDHGVRGIWIDMNEPTSFLTEAGGSVPNDLPVSWDGEGSTMAEGHNVYALEEARATFDGMAQAAPDHRPFVLTRAGYAGIQRYAAVWTGDATSSFPGLSTTLPMMLGMGLSGVPFIGSDVGGYSGSPSPELFARWMELGSLSPFFRTHVASGTPDQEPWAFGEEVLDISRSAIGLRYRLLPTLYSLFREASQTGAPVLRPLVYELQSDPTVRTLSDEALLGPSLLLAPVLVEGADSRAITLPKGRWYEYHSGAVTDGPATFDLPVTLGALPLFVRDGAILAHCQPMMWSSQAPCDPLELHVYPAEAQTTFTLYEDEGDSLAWQSGHFSEVTYTLARTPDGATLLAGPREGTYTPPNRRLLVRVRRVDHDPGEVLLDGAPLSPAPTLAALLTSEKGWWYDTDDLSIVVSFPDRPDFALTLSYDTTLIEPAPPVRMPFEVTVPPGTPPGPITIATSANGWTHELLGTPDASGKVSGTVEVPRGQWLHYKYTRGDWSTVEKWPGCVEATNRYAFGAAHPTKVDVIAQWADQCGP